MADKFNDRYLAPKGYYKNTKDKPVRKLLVETLQQFSDLSGDALDIGSGAGNESRFLAEHGFLVTAIDGHPEAGKFVAGIKNINFVCGYVQDFEFKEYDLINASFSLPFIERQYFDSTISKIFDSLKQGGVFTGQFFGLNDEWNKPKETMTFLTKQEVGQKLSGLNVILLNEFDQDGTIANGETKHWHCFDVIAQKS